MLWKKESNRSDAMYEDIYTQCQVRSTMNRICSYIQTEIEKSNPRKNDAISLESRQEGDKYFKKKNWPFADSMYDDSLCYAANGSENIGFAFAKRSKCFLEMNMYNECLKDIELAEKAGYPAKLMPELEQSKAYCMSQLENGEKYADSIAMLSFEPDENFPCMANVLKIEKNIDGKHSVVAKQDIAAGETIIVEDTLKFTYGDVNQQCAICLKDAENLIPCHNCSIAMFCSIECQQNFRHEYECGVKQHTDNEDNGRMMKNLRGIYTAINMFASVDELMDFVEQTISSDANELPESLVDERSKYRAFLKQRTGPLVSDEELAAMMISDFNQILINPKLNAMFNTTKHRRFLMHLIAQHQLINQHNSIEDDFHQYSCTGVMAAYFNHSCAPNALVYCVSSANLVYVLVRPVKKGEEVVISWWPFPIDTKTKQRKQLLWQHKGLNCECLRCTGAETDWAQRRIKLDKDFISIMSMKKKLNAESDTNEISLQIEKCVALLNKYGNINWCSELVDAIMAFTDAYNLQFN